VADITSPTPAPGAPAARRLDAGGIVYGVLAVATVIAAESTRQESYADLIGADLITMVLYWVAHAYAQQWGMRLRGAEEWSHGQFGKSLVHEATILAGSIAPTVALVVSWLVGASRGVAVAIVLWVAAVELVALEVGVGLRHRVPAATLLTRAAVSVALGLGILVLRILLH
jgi:hypothetical protein